MAHRMRTSVVADISIPRHILEISNASHTRRRSESDADNAVNGPVQQAVSNHVGRFLLGPAPRTASVALDGISPRGSRGRSLRIPSCADIPEEPAGGEGSDEEKRAAGRDDGEDDEAHPEPQVPQSALFSSLSSYSMSPPSSASVGGSFGQTPLQPSATHASSRHEEIMIAPDQHGSARRRSRRGTLADLYEKAKVRGKQLERKPTTQLVFEYCFYAFLVVLIYFLLIGIPLWKGAVHWLRDAMETVAVITGLVICITLTVIYAYAPLLILFEKDPPPAPELPTTEPGSDPNVQSTALLIPCYKSAQIVGPTLVAALKTFPPSHIFVIANGNSPTPLDETEEICRPYGVNHIWCPVGSKIVAQFVGCYAAKEFQNVLMIDDDCALPPNFPVVSDRLTDRIKSIGYTIKSVGPDASKGNLCQQAQDLEYKLAGLQRCFAGVIGSATFPHGAIALWDRDFLIKIFHDHPGFSVSEDWFFGHSCRRLGGRIKMCSAVFVETETPPAVFFSSGGSRGGFGEMTVFKQRFMRWNFFFVNGLWYNMGYIIGSWKLLWWEPGAKLFVFAEVFETIIYLLTPFVLPISLIIRPMFWGCVIAAVLVLYYVNVIIFNELHLRLKKERVGLGMITFYYTPLKVALTVVNVLSCYWSIYKYARYFAKRHPKVVEDENVVEVVLHLDEVSPEKTEIGPDGRRPGRSMSVTAVSTTVGN
ncbi:glycosyl transferase [Drechmeria coniospora]|uniref:Glycosyl transferase n=1 Tax=Drechmeria coniospora TaxID=98403 RepID=A0A151GLY4_DRECN|nr:glycosyl transferase [Drechmeria coniospora]KYK58125.1 glycosyl transferase [Drechmeria coniospora]ODA83034.1 hypothetical protein RJ55_01543 [Drechmeria coniospora]